MAQDRAGELGEEAFDEVEPGAVLGRESEFESVLGLIGEPSSGLFGDWSLWRYARSDCRGSA